MNRKSGRIIFLTMMLVLNLEAQTNDIGNETEILGAVRQRLGAARIFSFGVGSSVNRYLLDHRVLLKKP